MVRARAWRWGAAARRGQGGRGCQVGNLLSYCQNYYARPAVPYPALYCICPAPSALCGMPCSVRPALLCATRPALCDTPCSVWHALLCVTHPGLCGMPCSAAPPPCPTPAARTSG